MNPTILSPTLKSILHKIEAEHAQEPVWIVGPETGKMLYWLTRVSGPRHILEIGTSVGYSALWFASALEDNGEGQLFTIESHKERFGRSVENIEASGLGHRITQYKAHAPELFYTPEQFGYTHGELPAQIDLAFFDATKKQHSEFLDMVLPRMTADGLIVVDNVDSHRDELQEFLNELNRRPELEIAQIPVGHGLLIARVRHQ